MNNKKNKMAGIVRFVHKVIAIDCVMLQPAQKSHRHGVSFVFLVGGNLEAIHEGMGLRRPEDLGCHQDQPSLAMLWRWHVWGPPKTLMNAVSLRWYGLVG
jgi:hypothetical protein